jgi:hypothetical protein
MELAPLVVALGGAAFVAIVASPLLGAWLFLLLNPFLVGIARGQLGVPLRPNELLLLFLLAAVAVRSLLLMLCRRYEAPPFDGMDAALLGMVATGSLMPILVQQARGLPSSTDDVLYAVVLVKYYALFRLFRGVVLDEAAAATCLRVALAAGTLVALLAVLQVTGLFGVAEFLLAYYDAPFEGHQGAVTTRATSTIASSFGLGDLMIISLVAALALLRVARRGRTLLLGAAACCLAGVVVAGTISIYIGLAVALLAFGLLTRSLPRLLTVGGVAILAAALAFWPVIENRLAGFERPSGVPRSWEGRQANLERFFLPELSSADRWLFGVQPAPRVPAPEAWRDMVYIESGYVWLFWIGGLPFAVAFAWFTVASLRRLVAIPRRRADAIGCAAIASFCWIAAMAAMMLFDPHLTIRGGADLFFPMLAIALAPGFNACASPARARAPPPFAPKRVERLA